MEILHIYLNKNKREILKKHQNGSINQYIFALLWSVLCVYIMVYGKILTVSISLNRFYTFQFQLIA